MKQLLFLIFLLFWMSHSIVFAQQEIVFDPDLKLTKLTNQVWVVTHSFPGESNSLIVQTNAKEVVLIDTPYTNEATETILQYIQKEIKPQHITAILTGFHIDNLGGVGCLLQHKIPIYGSDLTCKLLDEHTEHTMQQVILLFNSPEQIKYRSIYANMKFEKPDHVFPIEKGLSLKKGKLSFDVYYPGESHSPDNLTVYIKELHLLFGGCMIKSLESKNLGFIGDANLTEWPKSVRKVQEKYADAQWVIPHHGKWGDRSLLQHTLDLLNNQTK